jgi:hypothetical protein
MSVGVIEGEGSTRLTYTGSDPGVYVTVLVYLQQNKERREVRSQFVIP